MTFSIRSLQQVQKNAARIVLQIYKSEDDLMHGHCYASYTGCQFVTGLTVS